MAKTFMLRPGHQTEFRRTIVKDKPEAKKAKAEEKYQLVLQPGVEYNFSDEELAGLQNEINAGILVPAETDKEGRVRAAKPKVEKPEHHEVPAGPALNDADAAAAQAQAAAQARSTRRSKGVDVGVKTADLEKAAKAAKAASPRAPRTAKAGGNRRSAKK